MESGNLLTGQQYVALDYFPDADPADLGDFSGYVTIPAVSTGLGHLETQLAELLKKLNSLPLEDVVVAAEETIIQLNQTLATTESKLASISDTITTGEIRDLITTMERAISEYGEDSEFQDNLTRAVIQLQQTLGSLGRLVQTLEEQPSSLLLPRRPTADPEPQPP